MKRVKVEPPEGMPECDYCFEMESGELLLIGPGLMVSIFDEKHSGEGFTARVTIGKDHVPRFQEVMSGNLEEGVKLIKKIESAGDN